MGANLAISKGLRGARRHAWIPGWRWHPDCSSPGEARGSLTTTGRSLGGKAMKSRRIRCAGIVMIALCLAVAPGVLMLQVRSAQASPITTSDFGTIFGAGVLRTLPAGLGGGTVGSSAITNGASLNATLWYAVWDLDLSPTNIYVFKVQNNQGSDTITQLIVNDFGPVALGPTFVAADAGVAPIGSGVLPGGDVAWTFGFLGGSPAGILGGQDSKRLYVGTILPDISVGLAALRDGFPEGVGPVPVPTPEPGTLLLLGSGLLGTGIFTRRFRKRG